MTRPCGVCALGGPGRTHHIYGAGGQVAWHHVDMCGAMIGCPGCAAFIADEHPTGCECEPCRTAALEHVDRTWLTAHGWEDAP